MYLELATETANRYVFLKRVSPKSELLKYFIFDELGFRSNPDIDVINEFVDRFGGKILTEDEIRKGRTKMSCAEYHAKFCSSLFKNYISSMSEEIRFALRKN